MNSIGTLVVAVAGGAALWQFGAIGSGGTEVSLSTVEVSAAVKVTVLETSMSLGAGNLQEEFRAFSATRPYHGAFALSEDGYFGYTYGYNDLEAAKVDALKYCSDERGAPCSVYAVLEPEVAQTALPDTMSAETHAGYNDYLQGLTHRAFALADNGAFALTWDWDARHLAEQEALAICAGYAKDENTADQAFATCRLVASD